MRQYVYGKRDLIIEGAHIESRALPTASQQKIDSRLIL